ncbi:MAG: hypothetical protein K6E49_07220 [Lachnospiraceae bacterium]|nr:hypothetical protein [Lachnospiraceae bacterium]
MTIAISVLMTATVFAKNYDFTHNDFSGIPVGTQLSAGDTLTLTDAVPDYRIEIVYFGLDGAEIGIGQIDQPGGGVGANNPSVIQGIADGREYDKWELTDRGTSGDAGFTHFFELHAIDPNKSDEPAGTARRPIEVPPGEYGRPYDDVIFATDGTTIEKAEIIGGSLPPGMRIVVDPDGKTVRLVGTPKEGGRYFYTVKITFADGTTTVISLPLIIKGGKNSGDSNIPAAKVNRDAIVVNYYLNQADYNAHRKDYRAEFGKQAQGPACQAAFNASVPQGWSQAFTFSMSYDKKNTTDLKNGIIEVYVPSDYIRPGRSYALMAMDKSGVVKIYQDTDAFPYVFTSPLNVEGYAFALLTKD